MARLVSNKIKTVKQIGHNGWNKKYRPIHKKTYYSKSAIFLAWSLFLILFFENGTLGFLPKEYYALYRNVRISDILIYVTIIYSLFKAKDYPIYFKSKLLIIIKVIALFFFLEFAVSSVTYNFNIIEFFFRLKNIWASFLIFPFLLLMKSDGLELFIKIMFPVSILSNILYILTSLTGLKFLPDVIMVPFNLPGGLQIYRVFGGTFSGDVFFLGIIFYWLTRQFKWTYFIPLLIFGLPHILAFGRAAWTQILFNILLISIWNIKQKKNFKVLIRQAAVLVLIGFALIYGFNQFIPESEAISEALELRVEQGREDYTHEEGSYGLRLLNIQVLLELWSKSNMLFGIGMHPFWVVKPVTVEEAMYAWGFSDIKWTSVLAAYGLVGFILAILFQIQFIFVTIKIFIKDRSNDIYVLFTILLLGTMIFDSFINYSYNLISFTIWGMNTTIAFFAAATIYKFHNMKTEPDPRHVNL